VELKNLKTAARPALKFCPFPLETFGLFEQDDIPTGKEVGSYLSKVGKVPITLGSFHPKLVLSKLGPTHI